MQRLGRGHEGDAIVGSMEDALGCYPSIEQLMREQGVAPIEDPSKLEGDFWPEDEPIELFPQALDEWRGRRRSDDTPSR
jgi:hypothetical protein